MSGNGVQPGAEASEADVSMTGSVPEFIAPIVLDPSALVGWGDPEAGPNCVDGVCAMPGATAP